MRYLIVLLALLSQCALAVDLSAISSWGAVTERQDGEPITADDALTYMVIDGETSDELCATDQLSCAITIVSGRQYSIFVLEDEAQYCSNHPCGGSTG